MLQKYGINHQTNADFNALLIMPNIVTNCHYSISDHWLRNFAKRAVIPTNISYHGNTRLGFYYQWLWQQLIIHHPDYSLIGEEIQLQSQQTVGALDFLVHNHCSDEIEHWEVAIKFYLSFEHQWPGPNAKDNLDKKVNRMVDHQLQLTDHPAFQYLNYPYPTQRRLIMQGRLFDAWPDSHSGSDMPINSTSLKGRWCYCSQATTLDLKILKKRQWIAPPLFSQLITSLNIAEIDVPTQAIDQDNQVWFIVPDHWPQHNHQL
ncbi:DUF1853 family protein [Photobacterium aquimaris]|uniref:DUF1853 domain-containing protein n=1 Tax=Photobacterium aquimaris TaxID=512643 RepID=A0A1Y6KUH7_9GAMM|nr:DUF1853 family protein [Photobacterium aquimaris]SMY15016.1 hypothetical protein PAQU9191_00232 [Photobacterium aquimaris]